ncbi:MAG: PAS domain S-box protein, partial [Burkholderiaceae bacterium]
MTSRHLVTLIVALGALALAMLTLLGQLTWTAYQESIHAAQTRTADYAAILNTQLDTSLRRVDANLRQLVRSTPVAALDQKAVSRYVSGLGAEWRSSLIDFPELRSLSIFDANGDLLYSTNADLERLNISDRGHFRALRGNPQAEVAFSEVVIARLSGWATVSVGRALRNDKGVFLGIAVATLDLSYLEKIFQTLAVGAGGNVALYRSDDFTLVLRQPRLEGRLNIPLPPDSPTRAALAAGNKMVSIIFTAASDGRERIYSYHVLERFPFFVSVGVAKDEVLASWRVRSLAVGLSAVLFFGVIIGLLVRLWRTEVGRTRAIAEALEAGDRMAAIVENSRDAIISRGADYKITTWNNAAERLFGYSAAEAIGQDSGMLTPPERLEATLYNRNLLEQGQGLLDIETVRLTKGGQRIDVSMRLSTIRAADGAVLAVSMVFRDIGARKHLEAVHQSLEEQLRESQKMQAIGTLAGGIAHDFNNILAAILGNADLMRQDLTANPEAMESLEEICKASRRGRDLVQQILAFSR